MLDLSNTIEPSCVQKGLVYEKPQYVFDNRFDILGSIVFDRSVISISIGQIYQIQYSCVQKALVYKKVLCIVHPNFGRVQFARCIKYTRLSYGVATISRMLKNIGLFCKRALQKRPVFCKETCIFKHPTHRSHPIVIPITRTELWEWEGIRESSYEKKLAR